MIHGACGTKPVILIMENGVKKGTDEKVSLRMRVRVATRRCDPLALPYGDSFRGRSISGRINIDSSPTTILRCVPTMGRAGKDELGKGTGTRNEVAAKDRRQMIEG